MADNRWFTIAQCLRACVICFVISHGHSQNLNTACIEVKKAYTEKGFDENEVPIAAISGADLSICPQGETCCTRSMEDRLTSLSRKEHRHTLDESFKLLKSIFASRTRKFDEFFTELLDNARNDLHEMFVKTYGLLYQQNSAIFTQLFDDLRGYYKGKDKNLMEVMENFFSKLLQKMFELLNSTYQFDDEYLRCVTVRMDDLKPFGDVPQKLSLHVKRAFIAARTFVQGLAVGRDVVTQIMEMAPSDSCVRGIVRMTYCPHCRGLTSTKPCSNYCLNTMKGCLAHQAELNDVWNEYIDALNNLASRLEGPFNIESVVDPIDVKISDAIMNLQENSAKVTTKIFAGCGTPRLSRKRRDQSDVSQTYTFAFPKTTHVRPTTAAGTSLDRLVRDIKEKVKTAKDFWVQLPYVVCNNEDVAADPSREDDCWNGQDRAKYIPEVQKDGVIHQINNPEVEVDVSKVNSLVNRQRVQLQLITNKLQHAYKGESVGWVDTEIDSVSSGSGSGDFVIDVDASGSGRGRGGPEDDEDSDFDIEENPIYTTGGRGHGSEHGGRKKPQGGKGKPTPGKGTNTWLGEDEHIIRKPGTGSKPVDDKHLDRDRNNYNRPGGNRRGNEERRNGEQDDPEDSAASLSVSMTVLLLVLSLQTGIRRLMLSW